MVFRCGRTGRAAFVGTVMHRLRVHAGVDKLFILLKCRIIGQDRPEYIYEMYREEAAAAVADLVTE